MTKLLYSQIKLLYSQTKPNEQKHRFQGIAHIFFGFDSEFVILKKILMSF